jgi:predicted nucleic acid-binding protein
VRSNGIVLDASAMVDLLVGHGEFRRRLTEATVHVPAHFDAEVLSALGRLWRAGLLTGDEAGLCIAALTSAPFKRHTLEVLLTGAWRRRSNLRLVDALYVEIAERLGIPLLTTDTRLASAYSGAQLL